MQTSGQALPRGAELTGWRKVLGRRVPGWEYMLATWARARLGAPFQWGLSDCALIGFQAVDIQLGTKLWEKHRFRYSTCLGAMRYQERYKIDAESVIEAASCMAIAPAAATVGDQLVLEREGFACLHVILDEKHSLSSWPDRGVALCLTAELKALPDVKAYTCA